MTKFDNIAPWQYLRLEFTMVVSIFVRNLHCKCLQGFTGVLRGNEAAGISNLQGLWVVGKPCKTF